MSVAAEAGAAEGSRTGRARGTGRPVVRRGRGRTVRGADARVVLRASPREADARVADGIALHLVDGHLGRVAVNELDEAATLSGGDLDVGDLTKTLEERSQLILGHIAREATDEHGSIVRVRELVHGHGVEARTALLVAEVGLLAHPLVAHGTVRHGGLGRHHGGVARKVLELTTLVTSDTD